MSPAPSAPAAAADAAPMSVEEALVHALRLHRAGHLEPAEKIYRAILGPLYPGRQIRCGLIYTETAKTYWLDASLMDASLAELGSK